MFKILNIWTHIDSYFLLAGKSTGVLYNVLQMAYIFLFPALGAIPIWWIRALTFAQSFLLSIFYYACALIVLVVLGIFSFVIVTGWAI